MAAPVGNQFWRQRSKHGREKLFNDPELWYDACCEYFNWCDTNPLKSYEYNGKDPVKCELEFMRAYTWNGLALYLDCDVKTLRNLETHKDFFPFFTRVANIIFSQKFEGAAAGLLKENIISRELGLIDKTENTGQATTQLIIQGQKFAADQQDNANKD